MFVNVCKNYLSYKLVKCENSTFICINKCVDGTKIFELYSFLKYLFKVELKLNHLYKSIFYLVYLNSQTT